MSIEDRSSLPPLPDREPQPGRRALKAAAVCALAGVLGFSGYYYGRPLLREHQRWTAEMPGVQKSLTAADERLQAAEEKLRSWAGDREAWQEHLDKVQARVNSGLAAARRQSDQLRAQLRVEMEQRAQAVQARVRDLESSQEADRVRLAGLERDLGAARTEMAQQGRQIALLREQTNRGLDHAEQQLASLHGDVGQQQRNLDMLDARTGRQRIDFEVSKNRSREVAPGVSLGVSRTNTAYRRVDGWLWLMPDRRTVWIRGQNVQRPVVFYTREDPRPRELVITHVTKDAVVGYVLMPAKPLGGGGVAQAGGSASGAPPAQ